MAQERLGYWRDPPEAVDWPAVVSPRASKVVVLAVPTEFANLAGRPPSEGDGAIGGR